MPKKTGFTLIELLVVITIIAVLAAIGLLSYSKFIQASRDARRQSDLKIIQSALEQYHADQKYYPPTITFGSVLTNATGVSPAPTVSKTYLKAVPKDPQGTTEYLYTASGASCASSTPQNCTGYCLYAKIEGTPPTSDSGCTPAPPRNFGVTKP